MCIMQLNVAFVNTLIGILNKRDPDELVDVYTLYCRTVITGKHVYYWIHGNISLKILCTDYNEWMVILPLIRCNHSH